MRNRRPNAASSPAPRALDGPARAGALRDRGVTRRRALAILAGAGVVATGCASARQAPAAEPLAANAFSVAIRGLSTHGVDLGAPKFTDDAAVVLIHGAGGNHRDWTLGVAPRLVDNRRVVAFDRPGFGRSERPETDPGRPQTQAAILADAAHGLGLDRYVLVGHSWGGAVAMAWALRHPERVAGLVIVSGATMPWSFGETLDYIGGGFGTIGSLLFGEGSTSTIALRKIFAPQAPPGGYAKHLGYASGLDAAPIWETVGDLLTLNGALGDMVDLYPSVSAPTTIVHGDRDRIVDIDVHARALSERLPQARLVALPGVGHMPHHARPDLIAAMIDRHVVLDRRLRRAPADARRP